jgi:class 3 adenylate cyclase
VSATSAPISPLISDAERRQLTVMFCQLVDSTALSAQLDLEDLRDVIAVYHRSVAAIVARFDGFVSRYMGDGVLVYFGYRKRMRTTPSGRCEQGWARSTLSVASMSNPSGSKPALGSPPGLVVVGDLIGEGSAQEQSAVGETPNLAARLQTLAEPDAVVIAAGTRRLVGDLFEYRDLGAVEVKGIAGPVPVWQVLRPSGSAAKPSAFVSLRSAARVRFSRSDDQSLSKLRLSSDRIEHSHGLRPQEFADPNRTSTPPMELVALGCGLGWHRHDWRDYWGRWNWGRCVPNY